MPISLQRSDLIEQQSLVIMAFTGVQHHHYHLECLGKYLDVKVGLKDLRIRKRMVLSVQGENLTLPNLQHNL